MLRGRVRPVDFLSAGGEAGPAFDVPHPKRMVAGGRNGASSVKCHCHDIDPVGVPFERAYQLAALQIPEAECPLNRGRNGTPPIGGYCDGGNPARMAFEDADRFANLQVPYQRPALSARNRSRAATKTPQVRQARQRTLLCLP